MILTPRPSWLVLVAGLAAATAQAQTTPPQPSNTPSAAQTANGNINLPPVDVQAAQPGPGPGAYTASQSSTATKTNTPIMEIPASVQVIPQQVIQDQAATNIGDITRDVSGVVTRGGGAEDNGQPWSGITIRGFNTDTMFRDGIRLDSFGSNSNLFTQQFANIQSVEILKGPAAILYGAVEPGGIINVVTKEPLTTPYYAIEQQFGSYSFYRSAIDMTGPLNDNRTLLYRLNMSYQDAGSQVDYAYDNDRFIAPVLEWRPDKQTDVKLEFEFRHADIGQNYGTIPLLNGVPINTSVSLNYAGTQSPDIETTYFGALTWSHKFDNDWTIRQKFVAQIIDQNSLGILPYDIFNPSPVSTPSGAAVANVINSVSNTTHIYNITTDATKKFETGPVDHDLLFGFDYTYFNDTSHIMQAGQTDTNYELVDLYNPSYIASQFSGPSTPLIYDWETITQLGAYAQDQLKLPGNFIFLGTLRYQYIVQNSWDYLVGYGLPASQAPTLWGHAFTPRVALLWRPVPWLSPYVSYTQSYGPAGVGEIQPNGEAVPPTSGEQYEVGLKTSFFNDRLMATVAGYHLTKTNIPTPDLANPNFVLLAQKAVSQGFEFDLKGELLPGWKVILNYAYTDARIIGETSSLVDITGSRLGGVPYNLTNLWTTYEFQDERLAGWKIGGGVTYSGAIPYEPNGGPTTQSLPPYAVIDLMTSYHFQALGTKWTAQLNIINLLDRRYFTEAQVNGFYADAPYSSFTGIYGQRRTAIGMIKAEF